MVPAWIGNLHLEDLPIFGGENSQLPTLVTETVTLAAFSCISMMRLVGDSSQKGCVINYYLLVVKKHID